MRGPYNQINKTRFIELVLVVDHDEYKSLNSDLSKVHQHTKVIANIMNSVSCSYRLVCGLCIIYGNFTSITIATGNFQT